MRVTVALRDQQPESAKLEAALATNLFALRSGGEGGKKLKPGE